MPVQAYKLLQTSTGPVEYWLSKQEQTAFVVSPVLILLFDL